MKTTEVKALNTCHFNGSHFLKEIACIVQVALATAPDTEDGVLWLTSANDSQHMKDSLHYHNRAFDFRVKNLVGYTGNALKDAKVYDWRARIRATLGSNYDVVIEGDHLHVEYDTKTA